MEIIKVAKENDVIEFEKLFNSNWKELEYRVDVTLTLSRWRTEENKDADHEFVDSYSLRMSLLHLIILLRKDKIIQSLANNKEISIEDWAKSVQIDPYPGVRGADGWIFAANCLHFAANFYPKGLHILLSNVVNKKGLIEATHSVDPNETMYSPLHEAVTEPNSLSTR